MPPKSQDFKKVERQVLGPVLAELGFRRPRSVGLGGWVRKHDSEWIVIWRQFDKWNYGEDPEGYGFTVELQLGSEPIAGLNGRRSRLYELLSEAERTEHLTIHNAVVKKTGLIRGCSP